MVYSSSVFVCGEQQCDICGVDAHVSGAIQSPDEFKDTNDGIDGMCFVALQVDEESWHFVCILVHGEYIRDAEMGQRWRYIYRWVDIRIDVDVCLRGMFCMCCCICRVRDQNPICWGINKSAEYQVLRL